MFSPDFFPTPESVIDVMLEGETIEGKVFLEPSGGKGNIVDYLKREGAKDVIAAENNADLKKILQSKCRVIADDFLTVEAHQISHIDMIVMNPPFSAAARHIVHAFNIAPAGCKIVALFNFDTYKHSYSNQWDELRTIVSENGSIIDLGACFATSERQTQVKVGMARLQKAGADYKTEFEGFFMEEEQEAQSNGIMTYSVVRDLVNRYVGAIKIYDEQLDAALKMNSLTTGFYSSEMAMTITKEGAPKSRNDFKKEMQKSGWKYIFGKMNMEKYATTGLKEEINKFVEKQHTVPFTMKNIYWMLEVVVGTTSQRMDKALLEVFDRLTNEYNQDNRFNVPGWKTNSHFLLGQAFIIPHMASAGYSGQVEIKGYHSNAQRIEDMVKALCYLTGENYDNHISLEDFLRYRYKLKQGNKYRKDPEYNHTAKYHTIDDCLKAKNSLYEQGIKADVEDSPANWGSWFDWGFFQVKAYKKGTMHFRFKDLNLWALFNQHISRLKGYPLFEGKEQSAYQNRNTGRKQKAA